MSAEVVPVFDHAIGIGAVRYRHQTTSTQGKIVAAGFVITFFRLWDYMFLEDTPVGIFVTLPAAAIVAGGIIAGYEVTTPAIAERKF